MSKPVRELSEKTFADGNSSLNGEVVDAGPLERVIDDEESVQYVLASSSGIEHSTNDRTTTIEPSSDPYAYIAVTNKRIHILLGENPESAELSFDLVDVTGAKLKNGLLSTTLIVTAPDNTVQFSPEDSERGEIVASYIDRIGSAWSDLNAKLTDARELLDTLEEALLADDPRTVLTPGDDVQTVVHRARSCISNARHYATHEDDAPTKLMQTRIEPIAEELQRLRVEARLDRFDILLEDVEDAEDHEAACERIVEAHELLGDAQDAIDDVDIGVGEFQVRLGECRDELDDVADDLLGEAEEACQHGLSVDDPATAIESWETGLAYYRAALKSGWNGPAGVTEDALRFQLAWVVQNLIDSLSDRAAELEDRGDELGVDHEDAVERFQNASDCLVRAQTLADEHPYADPSAFDDRLADLDDKVDRAEWQWGSGD